MKFCLKLYITHRVINPAISGGESLYLNYKNVLNELLLNEEGERCLSVLNENKYPFQTPKSFDKNQTIIWNKIIEEDNTIRFRHDCIENGIKKFSDKINKEMKWALEYLVDIINNNKNIEEFNAVADDLIIIDNRHGLHARKDFTDTNRHYIRARASKN